MQKAQAEINQVVATTNGNSTNEEQDAGRVVIYEDGTVAPRSINGHDDDASIRAMMSPTKTSLDTSVSPIPMIRVSSESGREERETGEQVEQEEEDISRGPTPQVEQDEEDTSRGPTPPDKVDPNLGQNGVAKSMLEKPVQAAAGEAEPKEGETAAAAEAFSFSNKRLCERWLDNLFMVLYEVCCAPSYPSFFSDAFVVHCLGSSSMDYLQG